MGLNEQLNNFIKILDLLKKKGGFSFLSCHGNLVFVFLIEISEANLYFWESRKKEIASYRLK